MPSLWNSDKLADWQAALDSYDKVVALQGVARLPELDRWYRDELPAAIAERQLPHVTHFELVQLAQWKMARGVWRPRNLALVRGNDPRLVSVTSATALSKAPHPTAPISGLSELAGVGPATASAVVAAAYPGTYPFFDDLVAAQVPRSGPVTFTLAFYAKYAAAVRARAEKLGGSWTPVMVERALWAHVGGKAGAGKRH